MPIVLSLVKGNYGVFFVGHMIRSAIDIRFIDVCLGVWVKHNQCMKCTTSSSILQLRYLRRSILH